MKPRVNNFKNFIEVLYDKITGVKYGEKIVIELELNDETTKESIENIVSEMDHRTLLKFYDAYFGLQPNQNPVSLGDSGAFTDVRIDGNKFYARLGNHGGYKLKGKWIKMTDLELVNNIYKSRMFNGGKMKIESRSIRKQWRNINDGIGLFEFHHDISDKKNLCQQRV